MADKMKTRVMNIYIYICIHIAIFLYVHIAYRDYAGIHSGMEKSMEITIRSLGLIQVLLSGSGKYNLRLSLRPREPAIP